MKKILTTALVAILAAGALHAQNKQNPFIGGSIALDHWSEDDLKLTAFQLNPQVGFMFNEHWGVAIDLGYTYIGETWDDGETESGHAFGLGVSGLYMLKIVDKFYYAPTLRVGFTSGRVNMNGLEDMFGMGDKNTVIGADLNFVRFEFRPSHRWGFNLGLGGLGITSFKFEDQDRINNISFNIVNGATIGMKYYF